jgi:hypothetical protein
MGMGMGAWVFVDAFFFPPSSMETGLFTSNPNSKADESVRPVDPATTTWLLRH